MKRKRVPKRNSDAGTQILDGPLLDRELFAHYITPQTFQSIGEAASPAEKAAPEGTTFS